MPVGYFVIISRNILQVHKLSRYNLEDSCYFMYLLSRHCCFLVSGHCSDTSARRRSFYHDCDDDLFRRGYDWYEIRWLKGESSLISIYRFHMDNIDNRDKFTINDLNTLDL